MCGRFAQRAGTPELEERFGLALPGLEIAPRYNIAPGQPVPVIIQDQGPRLVEMSWGLLPFWAKDPGKLSRPINARSETLAEKPFFREPYKRRRCLVPADGFYEWKSRGRGRPSEPHFFELKRGGLFALAGLYDVWRPPKEGAEPIRSFTIVTTGPNPLMERIHDRMPVILAVESEEAWLDPGFFDAGRLAGFLRPYPAEEMTVHPVSRAVNSVANDSPELVKPAPKEQGLFGD